MKRIWIYQANRILTAVEADQVNVKLAEFAAQWKVHGQPLTAFAELKDNLFIILKVDEDHAAASGCSIDSSVRFLKTIEQEFNIDLFDRMQLAFKKGDEIKVANRTTFETLVQEGVIQDDTIVFDNTITREDQLENAWALPFKDSWHKRVFA